MGAIARLISAFCHRHEQARFGAHAKPRTLVGREHESALLVEEAPAVRTVFLDAFCAGTTTTRDLAPALCPVEAAYGTRLKTEGPPLAGWPPPGLFY
jgi:hypothetical protein